MPRLITSRVLRVLPSTSGETPMVVGLEPSGYITIRKRLERRTYTAPASWLYDVICEFTRQTSSEVGPTAHRTQAKSLWPVIQDLLAAHRKPVNLNALRKVVKAEHGTTARASVLTLLKDMVAQGAVKYVHPFKYQLTGKEGRGDGAERKGLDANTISRTSHGPHHRTHHYPKRRG